MSDFRATSVELSIVGEVAEIQLVPPEGKPPTLDQTVLAELDSAVEAIEQSAARIVYVKSASERYFCVGANIAVLKDTNTDTIGPWVREGHRVLNRLEDLACPVVALVSGYAMGGGLELAMACDLIFADATAKFAQSESSLGFIPGWGGSRRLAERIGAGKAKYYFYTADQFDGQTGHEFGLVDVLVETGGLDMLREGFSRKVLSNNHNAIRTFKKIVNAEVQEQRQRNVEAEAVNSVGCLEDTDTLQRLERFLNRKR